MTNQRTLNTGDHVVLDGSGNGHVILGPPLGVRWTVGTAAVRTDQGLSTPPFPACKIYMGSGQAIDVEFVDGTRSGNFDSTSKTVYFPLSFGQKIRAEWSGGIAGTTATLSIMGTEEIP